VVVVHECLGALFYSRFRESFKVRCQGINRYRSYILKFPRY
jgi:hypothetical protein